jgi:hypothetical protein
MSQLERIYYMDQHIRKYDGVMTKDAAAYFEVSDPPLRPVLRSPRPS